MNPDFLILGGGIIGLSTALELARDGARVTVVERGVAGGESSWAGGGILSPLLPWNYATPVNRLCNLGNALYPDWVADLQSSAGVDPEYWRCGMLVLPPFDARAAADWCTQYAWPLDTLRADHLMPGLATSDTALWLPEVAQVRNPRLIKALRAAVLARGIRLMEGVEITAVTRACDTRLGAIETSSGRMAADRYIMAAGAWSQTVLGNIAPRWPIKPMRGQMLLFKAAPDLLPHIVYRQGIYLIPRRDGHILAGSTVEDVGFDKSTTETVRQMLYNAATGILPALRSAPLVQHWSGLRPGSPDNIPTIARHPLIENLYANTGHFRYGVTMAPASTRLLAELIAGRKPTLDMAPYQWTL
ncbi:MAG TPA: glycine oxidase ThiO [Sulfuriferula sp.]|nr:glycine oxidase ThiO [Sulfuriferula sp.]